jgi:hypothetical protein
VALNTVTLTWNITDFLVASITDSCTIYLTPTTNLDDVTDGRAILAITRSQSFTGGTGSLAGIIANDNVQLTPTGSGYIIRIQDNVTLGYLLGPFTSVIAFANGATQDLSAIYASRQV